MGTIGIIVGTGMFSALLVALGISRTLRRSKSQDADEAAVARLNQIKSPSGQPFFEDEQAALKLSEDIHALERDT